MPAGARLQRRRRPDARARVVGVTGYRPRRMTSSGVPRSRRTHRMAPAVAAIAVAAGVAGGGGDARVQAIRAEPVATGLEFPAAFTFAPDGRIFYGERLTGEIRIFNPATRQDSLFFDVPDVATTGEQGLLGLALHPDYPITRLVYAFVTRLVNGDPVNEIIRLVDAGGTASTFTTTFVIRAGRVHNGGKILFGPDRMLYAVVGDGGSPAHAQHLPTRRGKILRLTPDGRVPADNPFTNSYVFAYGIRNSFGMAFDPWTERLWETDNGPECNDELNLVPPGGNLGWGPTAECVSPPRAGSTNRDGPNPLLPKAIYNPTTAPTGVAFCRGCGLAGSEGALFFAEWNTGRVRRAYLGSSPRTSVAVQGVVYTHPRRILAVERSPGGALHISDSGGIYRLVPG